MKTKESVDNIEVELPSITILIIANTKRFYGNEFWHINPEDYIDGWKESETHDNLLEIYGFIDESHLKNCLKQIQTPLKISQGSLLSFTINKNILCLSVLL